jgi:hypothetical protein
MSSGTFRPETPAEYFKELVETAIVRQDVASEELTTYYVVNMLCGFVQPSSPADVDTVMDEPLALRLARALEAGGTRQKTGLRRVGDMSLFISGFFSDSLQRKRVDVDYYAALGGYAYASLARDDHDALATAYTQLSEQFVDFVDVLAEVSEQSGLTSNTDLLRLYEKWLRTGSRRDGQRLVERGIVPNASIGSRFMQ